MKAVYEISLLYDFYAPLLTEAQQEILSMYYFDDLSLSEIGETKNVSRAAAHDLIKRSEAKLIAYEEKLHLIDRFRAQGDRIEKIRTLAEEGAARKQSGSEENRIFTEILKEAQILSETTA